MMHDWLSDALRWREEGKPFVIVTVLGVRGSAPVSVGRRMLVAHDCQSGSVGGGRLEHDLTSRARAWLAGDEDCAKLAALSLGARLGQCCGGKVVAHFELVSPVSAPVVVFGAGHVSQELVPILSRLSRPVMCVDSRKKWLELLPEKPRVDARHETDPVALVSELPAASACLVLTHRHDLDFELCQALLGRDDLAFVGVIGSVTKGNRFRDRLAARGLPAERLECPIGEPMGKEPAVVAIALAARLCQVLHGNLNQAGEPDRDALRLLNALATAKA